MNTSIPARVRQDRIVEMIQDRDFVRVSELATEFDISEVTVRSDLDQLDEKGRLLRVRGGAMPRSLSVPEQPFEITAVANSEEKIAIGRLAVSMLSPGDSIILDVGTTTTALAYELAKDQDLSEITVFTNSLTIAIALEPSAPRVSVVLTGGTVRPMQHSLVGPFADAILNRIHARYAFLGCNGVDVTAGVTNINLPETEMKMKMMNAADRTIVLADGQKLGRVALVSLCQLEDVDVLITGQSVDAEVLGALQDTGIDLRVA